MWFAEDQGTTMASIDLVDVSFPFLRSYVSDAAAYHTTSSLFRLSCSVRFNFLLFSFLPFPMNEITVERTFQNTTSEQVWDIVGKSVLTEEQQLFLLEAKVRDASSSSSSSSGSSSVSSSASAAASKTTPQAASSKHVSFANSTYSLTSDDLNYPLLSSMIQANVSTQMDSTALGLKFPINIQVPAFRVLVRQNISNILADADGYLFETKAFTIPLGPGLETALAQNDSSAFVGLEMALSCTHLEHENCTLVYPLSPLLGNILNGHAAVASDFQGAKNFVISYIGSHNSLEYSTYDPIAQTNSRRMLRSNGSAATPRVANIETNTTGIYKCMRILMNGSPLSGGCLRWYESIIDFYVNVHTSSGASLVHARTTTAWSNAATDQTIYSLTSLDIPSVVSVVNNFTFDEQRRQISEVFSILDGDLKEFIFLAANGSWGPGKSFLGHVGSVLRKSGQDYSFIQGNFNWQQKTLNSNVMSFSLNEYPSHISPSYSHPRAQIKGLVMPNVSSYHEWNILVSSLAIDTSTIHFGFKSVDVKLDAPVPKNGAPYKGALVVSGKQASNFSSSIKDINVVKFDIGWNLSAHSGQLYTHTNLALLEDSTFNMTGSLRYTPQLSHPTRKNFALDVSLFGSFLAAFYDIVTYTYTYTSSYSVTYTCQIGLAFTSPKILALGSSSYYPQKWTDWDNFDSTYWDNQYSNDMGKNTHTHTHTHKHNHTHTDVYTHTHTCTRTLTQFSSAPLSPH